MKNDLATFKMICQCIETEVDIHRAKCRVVECLGKVCAFGFSVIIGCHAVYAHNFVPLAQESFCEMAPNEAGRPCYHCSHRHALVSGYGAALRRLWASRISGRRYVKRRKCIWRGCPEA